MISSRNYPAMQLKAGAVLAVAAIVTLLALIFPTKGVNPFSPKMTLTAYFPAVAGLRESSPVWFSGVEVGSVKYVDFVPGQNPPQLKVIFSIERKIRPYLHRDAVASIEGMGLLGDMYIDLQPGSPNLAIVENGETIAGKPPDDTKADLAQVLASAKGVLKNLEAVSSDLANGRGTLGQLVKNPGVYEDLQGSLRQFKQFFAQLNDTEGSFGKLLKDPALYDELVAAVKDMRGVIEDLHTAENKILSPENQASLEKTVRSAAAIVKKYGDLQEKLEQIRFDFNFGLDRYSEDISDGHADLMIWPNGNRYYQAGIQKVSRLYGNETDLTTFNLQLAWRIFDTPFFIRGGMIRDDYFVAGLDLRSRDNNLKALVDVYRVEFNPLQVDLKAGWILLDVIELSAGAEDILHHPFYKAGITIHYRDDDLINVGLKTAF
jgi:phospholipid/cholesterol/gamma-HCH transport system substrate-binding protein